MKKMSWFLMVLLFGTLTSNSREMQEWCSITSYDANKTDLPRVLIIGDSIVSRYASAVNGAIKGKAYLSVMATSKAVGDPALLEEIKTILSQYKYAVVHFNIGLHGFEPLAYKKGFPEMIDTIRKNAPGAKLMWRTTTPCKGDAPGSNVRKCNEIAAEFAAKENIAVDDLFAFVMGNADKPDVMWDGGGVHFTEAGAALQGKQVAQSILALLPAKP
jgi:hypothetical protein